MGAKTPASGPTVASGTAVPLPLGQIDDLRFGPGLLQEPEGAGAPGEPRDLAAGVGKVTEDDGPGRARLGAGGDVFPGPELPLLDARALPGLLQAVVAERAFLHAALGGGRTC